MLSKKDFTQRIAKRLREIRERKNISQEELAFRSGLYRTYVGHSENARYSPSAYVLYKIAEALQIDYSELVKS